jgi:hypothetical protein
MYPGKFADGAKFVRERAAFLKDNYGLDPRVLAQIGGPAGRIAIVTQHETMAELEEIRRKIMADPGAATQQAGAEGLMLPGKTMDQIWLEV